MYKFFLSISIFAVCIGFEPVRSISRSQGPAAANIEPAVFTSAAYRSLDTEHFSVFYGPGEAAVGQIAYLLELSYEHFLDINGRYGFELHPGSEKNTGMKDFGLTNLKVFYNLQNGF